PEYLKGSRFMSIILRVDKDGRLVIPAEIIKRIGIEKFAKLRLERRKIILEPAEDPPDRLSILVKRVNIKASLQPELISRIAEEELLRIIPADRKIPKSKNGKTKN
ncbi:MAG: hypothetical protein ACTSXX_01580, partial [Candidatus Baldrarchaeia archaeon]